MNILIVGSSYSLLCGMLINQNYNLIIYSNGLERVSKIKKNVYVSSNYLNNKNISALIKYYIKLVKNIYFFKKIKSGRVLINHYLFEINYIKHLNINLIEDGLESYNINSSRLNKFQKLKYYLKGDFTAGYRYTGVEKKIEKIYLTGLAPIPKEINNKVETINLKKLWNERSLEEQNEILDLFSFDLNIKETIKGRDTILFTQPLSEDGVITEDEKIEIYSKIIKKYSQDRLIVKTHPREKTSYKEIFKDNLVLDNPFPFEILNLLDVKFNKAVTLFSTAALGLGEDVKVDFYGTEVNDKILARFGSCDNIMKRNSYLEEEE